MKKTGQLGGVPTTIMTIALIAVIAVVVSIVFDKLANTVAPTSTSGQTIGNLTANGTAFLTNVTGQLPLLGTIIILGIVIASIVAYFGRKAM